MQTTDKPICGKQRPGDGDPRYGIPRCTLPADHTESADARERMHSGPIGPDGWARWGANYRP